MRPVNDSVLSVDPHINSEITYSQIKNVHDAIGSVSKHFENFTKSIHTAKKGHKCIIICSALCKYIVPPLSDLNLISSNRKMQQFRGRIVMGLIFDELK
jgi:hypothetical protein